MADTTKLVKLPDEVDDPMNAFIANEAKFYSLLATCVERANGILAGVAGESSNKNNTYVSRQDYKNFFGMDEKMVNEWIKYATNVLGREELVRGIDKIKVSWLRQKKSSSSVTDANSNVANNLKK